MATASSFSLTSLLGRTSLDDHEQILKASEAALKSSKNDIQAQHTKAVALLKLDRYAEALEFFEQSGTKLQEAASFEYSYTLYKLGNFAQALEIATRNSHDRGSLHVAVQAAVRQEEMRKAVEYYNALRQEDHPNEQFDLKINIGAIDAHRLWLRELEPASVPRPSTDDLSTFETAFNSACISIAKGQLAEAEMLLKRASNLCQHNEELSAEEKTQELFPIKVQHLYVLTRQGKIKEAASMAQEISTSEISDASTRALAISNIASIPSQVSNPFEIRKFLSEAPVLKGSDQPFSYQATPLVSNARAIDLQTFKFDGLAKSTRDTLSKTNLPSTSPDILLQGSINAAALGQGESGKAAVKRVLAEVERRPNDLGLIITLVQMCILAGNSSSAIDLLEALFRRLESSNDGQARETRFSPGLISLVVGLYRQQGRTSRIRQELAKAASYWRSHSQPPSTLLQAAGASLLESFNEDDLQTAREIFQKLQEQQPHDRATTAGFVASHAGSDLDQVKPLAQRLTSVGDLTATVDADSLETSGILPSSNALAIAQAGRGRKRAAEADTSAKKRVRTSRLPKDFDPNKKPDPERWLPMKDRSYYKPPKGKKKGKSQGGVTNEALDISNKAPAGGETLIGGPGGGGKKKKGKGRK